MFSAAALDGEWDVSVVIEGVRAAAWTGSGTRRSPCEWSVEGGPGALVFSANYLDPDSVCADRCDGSGDGGCAPYAERPLVRLGSVVASVGVPEGCALVFDEATACGHPPLEAELDGGGPSTLEAHTMMLCPDEGQPRRGCFAARLVRRHR